MISGLIEAHGQGGSGYVDKDWPYHNSFLIADRARRRTCSRRSDRRWALRRVHDVGSASNHLGIGADWDALADGTIEHAIANGWWDEDGRRALRLRRRLPRRERGARPSSRAAATAAPASC